MLPEKNSTEVKQQKQVSKAIEAEQQQMLRLVPKAHDNFPQA